MELSLQMKIQSLKKFVNGTIYTLPFHILYIESLMKWTENKHVEPEIQAPLECYLTMGVMLLRLAL